MASGCSPAGAAEVSCILWPQLLAPLPVSVREVSLQLHPARPLQPWAPAEGGAHCVSPGEPPVLQRDPKGLIAALQPHTACKAEPGSVAP